MYCHPAAETFWRRRVSPPATPTSLEDDMKKGIAGKALITTILITLLSLGVYAFADSGYPTPGPNSQGWQNNGGTMPGYGNTGRGSMNTPGSRNMPYYGNQRGHMNGGNMPMMGTPNPGYSGNQMNRGRMMNPNGGNRNCSW
jgi:hypothetical protein